ncbi:nucleotide exchange factor GrpE [Alphaproteobacteria bacterium]|nr:nucleotide exchange factor GrpE [Alphaproteobacteria bacterium]
MEKNKENTEEVVLETNDPENINEQNQESQQESSEEKIVEENQENINNENEEDKLKEEISSLKDEKIRVLAEMENLRKRFDREKIDFIKYGSVNFARDILSPGDNLERALSAVNSDEDYSDSIKNLIEGLLMVKKEFATALEKNNVTKIDTINKKFDPNLHQAMMEVENDDLDEGIVVQEIQSGYIMHDRLLRPAMVGVSKKSQQKSEVEINPDFKDDDLIIEKESKK